MWPRVAAFTDTYLPTVNGVSYTIAGWRERWANHGSRMDVIYPRSNGYVPDDDEHPVPSLPFPFYEGYRLGFPRIPDSAGDADVVHAHTPFGLGVAGLAVARRNGLPLVASYHTPTGAYAEYLAPTRRTTAALRRACRAYERWFLDRADLVIAPSDRTRSDVRELGVETPVRILPNGIDLDTFRPVDPDQFLATHGIDTDRPLIGYTGRHGYEKELPDLVEAVAELDVQLLVGGDGPVREQLETRADELGIDARFLGFLDRKELPAFYSALDAFAFPSPVETEGLVAREATACGTPVVAVDSGALVETVEEGVTGYHYEPGSIDEFRDAIERTLADRERLAERCLDRREELGMDRTLAQLSELYRSVQSN